MEQLQPMGLFVPVIVLLNLGLLLSTIHNHFKKKGVIIKGEHGTPPNETGRIGCKLEQQSYLTALRAWRLGEEDRREFFKGKCSARADEPYADLPYDRKWLISRKSLIFESKLARGVYGEVFREDFGLSRPVSVKRSRQTPLKFERRRILGEGEFGQVWRGKYKTDGVWRPVAIKGIRTFGNQSLVEVESATLDLLGEIKIHQYLLQGALSQWGEPHRNIVQYLGSVVSGMKKRKRNAKTYLVTELCAGGDLQSYLKRYRKNPDLFINDLTADYLPEETPTEGEVKLKASHLMRWAEDIASGLAELSRLGVVHRDVAARNILLALRDGEASTSNRLPTPDQLIAKITDFGISRNLIERGASSYRIVVDGNGRPRKLPVRWLALESLPRGGRSELQFTTKSDVWGMGVTFWEMFTLGKFPYQALEDEEVYDFLWEGGRLPKPEYAPAEMWQLMMECWEAEPDLQPSAGNILRRLRDLNERIRDGRQIRGGGVVNEGIHPVAEVSGQIGATRYCQLHCLGGL